MSQPAAAEPSPDAPVTVIWPEMTRFNPDTTPYTIDVDYEGDGTLFLWYGRNDTTVMLEPHGPYTLEFPASERNRETAIGVVECPEPQVRWECPLVAQSPWLEPYSDAVPGISWPWTWPWMGPGVGPMETARFQSEPDFDAWEVAWEVVREDDRSAPPLVSGVETGMRGGDHLPAIGDVPSLVSGDLYVLRVKVSGDVPPFGPLEGVFEDVFVWDAAEPEFTLAIGHLTPYPDSEWVHDDTIYPVEDGQVDYVGLQVWGDDRDFAQSSVVVTDEVGNEVFRGENRFPSWGYTWYGRDDAGRVLPEGDYTVSMTVHDRNLNATTKSRTIALSHDRLTEYEWQQTFAAADVMTRGHVGACGQVKQPARRGWRGSVGLYTSDTCRPAGQRFSRARFEVDLPLSPGHTVLSAALAIDGAMARREQRTRLWVRLRDSSADRWLRWTEIPGYHALSEIPVPAGVVSAEDSTLEWEAKVSNGDSYDLRDFTVELRSSTFD